MTDVEIILQEKAQALKEIPGITIARCGSWLWVSGDTKAHKEELKALGLQWTPQKSKWYFAGVKIHSKKRMSWDYIVDKYGLEVLEV